MHRMCSWNKNSDSNAYCGSSCETGYKLENDIGTAVNCISNCSVNANIGVCKDGNIL